MGFSFPLLQGRVTPTPPALGWLTSDSHSSSLSPSRLWRAATYQGDQGGIGEEDDNRRQEIARTRRAATPTLRRLRSSSRTDILFTPFGSLGAVSDVHTFPHRPDCMHCARQLHTQEARWGTGLCDECYEKCQKTCCVCNSRLKVKHLQWGVKMCSECFEACDKTCRMCRSSLVMSQLHWGTGLCNGCYNQCEKICKMCNGRLHWGQLHWGTGLCDKCYNSHPSRCLRCKARLGVHALRWRSGLCNGCYDTCEKTCTRCAQGIALGSLHWQSGLCDECYDKEKRTCRKCKHELSDGRVHRGTGLCDDCYNLCPKTCNICETSIDSKQLYWGTGLCDTCYDTSVKECGHCKSHLPFGQLHWGTSLCDTCFDRCEKTCLKCQQPIEFFQLHWGTGLCNPCFDSCDKTCRRCSAQLHVGHKHLATGFCDNCYKAAQKYPQEAPRLSRGVRAAVGAQLIFYFAQFSISPALYLQIQEQGWGAGAYAVVLATASATSMVAPVPLGLWAEHRGAREVYTGVALAGAIASLVMACTPPLSVLAMAWAILIMPPAIRGVRSTYFAKNVAPEDLNRAGQLASSLGLMGGFLGPMHAALLQYIFGDGLDGSQVNGFLAGTILSAVVYTLCASILYITIPPKRDKRPNKESFDNNEFQAEQCERCYEELSSKESRWATLLCDKCYDSYYSIGGINYSFKRYRTRVLVSFCVVASLLEVSMNAGILATFQPLVVTHFQWGPAKIASVNFSASGLSVIVSTVMVKVRLEERFQLAFAAALYFLGVAIFTAPPITEWRMILGMLVGIKSQILFMAPFSAIFSRLIGRERVTNQLTTVLCLAPAMGAALGTLAAPIFVSVAGTALFMVAGLPAFISVMTIACGWHMMDVSRVGALRRERKCSLQIT